MAQNQEQNDEIQMIQLIFDSKCRLKQSNPNILELEVEVSPTKLEIWGVADFDEISFSDEDDHYSNKNNELSYSVSSNNNSNNAIIETTASSTSVTSITSTTSSKNNDESVANQRTHIICHGLSNDVTVAEFREMVESLHIPYSCDIVIGYAKRNDIVDAFLEFENSDAATKALQILKTGVFRGQKLKVNILNSNHHKENTSISSIPLLSSEVPSSGKAVDLANKLISQKEEERKNLRDENGYIWPEKMLKLIRNSDNHYEYDKILINHLPPICLTITLPEDYPSVSPPILQIDCVWLTPDQQTRVCSDLMEVWKDSEGSPILFSWIEKVSVSVKTILSECNNQLKIEIPKNSSSSSSSSSSSCFCFFC
eukprot:c20388_g1_i5.p1 GENE.c20388_g1_i5~~c20388_g1_i5.p1  ORF type:complete len:369 (+),score=136.52 c20388_g1_i5:1-1107(+)